EDFQMLCGLVDAQSLWGELEELASDSAAVVRNVIDNDGKRTRREFNSGLLTLQDISARLARHNLKHDDLLLAVQGRRRAVAVTSLKSWNYQDVVDRIT